MDNNSDSSVYNIDNSYDILKFIDYYITKESHIKVEYIILITCN